MRHLLDDVSGFGQGFDRMDGPGDGFRPAEVAVSTALGWLEEPRTPVFLWLHVYDAHYPYATRDEFDALYADEIDHSKPPVEWPELIASARGEITNLDVPLAQYKAEISYLDRELGRLLEQPIFQDGIVGLVGDHGESLVEHETYFTHTGLYPNVLHVPLIVRWPNGPRGMRVPGIVNHVDLGRTLLDLSGMEGVDFPGQSLVRHVDAGGSDEIHFALSGSNTAATITKDGMHLVLQLKRHRGPYSMRVRFPHQVELYDLNQDPGCTENLAESKRELATQLRAGLIRWLEAASTEGLIGGHIDDAELAAQLANLGYVDLGDSGSDPLWTPDDCEYCAPFDA